jgi:hypothetical protein
MLLEVIQSLGKYEFVAHRDPLLGLPPGRRSLATST